MLKKICNEPGCNTLINYSERYCSKHKKDPLTFKKAMMNFETEYADLYRSEDWRKRSKRFLQQYPFCVHCCKKAEVVDHITPHRGNELLFNDENNWQPLCKQCHDQKTRREMNQRKKEESFNYQRRKRNGWYL